MTTGSGQGPLPVCFLSVFQNCTCAGLRVAVPTNQYFVLGDNRSNSLDSRFFGFVPRDSIVGRPTTVYFSQDTATHTVRWECIGRSVSR
jgi:hypothetical protein